MAVRWSVSRKRHLNPGCELCGSLVMIICHVRNQSGKVLTTSGQAFSMLSQPHHNFIKRFLAFEFLPSASILGHEK